MALIYAPNFERGVTAKYAKVLSRLPPASSVLEMGCYAGSFTRVLIDNGHSVLGIEKDKEGLEAAKDGGMPVIYGDIEDRLLISSIEKKFDSILFMDVLEHLIDPSSVLKRAKLLLNRNGRIMVTGPNVAYWAIRKDLLLGRWMYEQGGIRDSAHLRWYTAFGWRSLIENSGYKIVLFEAVEGMIPLEHVLSKLPLIGFLTPFLRDTLTHLWPGLFALIYFIEAIPANDAVGDKY